MSTRRDFLKMCGVGAVAAPVAVAAAAVAATAAVDEPIYGESPLKAAVEQGLINAEQAVSQAWGFGPGEVERAKEFNARRKGIFYDTGVDRPKFIAPPTGNIEEYARRVVKNINGPIKNIKLDLNAQAFRIERHHADELDISSKTFTLRVRDEGTEYLLDTMFTERQLVQSWHFGLIDAAGFTGLCDMDRYANKFSRGWTEVFEYWGGRPRWDVFTGEGAAFHIRGHSTVKGIFVAGGPCAINKGDHSLGGVLWAMALFDQGDIFVEHGDTLIIKGIG